MSAPESRRPFREFADPPGEFAVSPREFAFPQPEFADSQPDAVSAPSLADRQAALVAALVAGGPAPAGVDPARLDAVRRSLLRKRAGEAARHWPLLAASLGPDWTRVFTEHHDGHEPVGALRDGWDVARALRDAGTLRSGAAGELAEREAGHRYDGGSDPSVRPLRGLLNRMRKVRGDG